MIRRVLVPFIVLLFTWLVVPNSVLAQNSFEGAEVCGMCHKTDKAGKQLSIWKDSKHAQAFKALQTKEADEIAMKKFNKKAVDAPECLKCHTTGYGVDKKMFGAKFKVEDGVQCEACHGAGSAYKSMKVMKDKDAAVKAGLMVHKDVKKFCETCHNAESPTFKGFDYDKMWAKIAHDIPKN